MDIEQDRTQCHLQSLEAAKVNRAQETQRAESSINHINDIQQQQDIDDTRINSELNNKSQARYLEYVKDKKSEMNCRNKMLDTALVAHGRRMQPEPTNKTPYQKSFR